MRHLTFEQFLNVPAAFKRNKTSVTVLSEREIHLLARGCAVL